MKDKDQKSNWNTSKWKKIDTMQGKEESLKKESLRQSKRFEGVTTMKQEWKVMSLNIKNA